MAHKTVKKSWREVSIADFAKLEEVQKDSGDSIDQEVQWMSVLSDYTADEIYAMSIKDVADLRGQLEWSGSFDFDRQHKVYHIKTPSFELDITKHQQMIYSQYVDFQLYIKDVEKNRAQLLSTMYVPKGHQYNDGYDLGQLIAELSDIDIVTFNEACFFFMRRYAESMRSTLQSFRLRMKALRWLTRDRTAKEQLRTLEKVTEAAETQLTHGSLY